MSAQLEAIPLRLKLDLGCGTRKQPGFTGVDARSFPGVDVTCDLGSERWPFDDASVAEVRCSHLVEHLSAPQRIHFVNELYRVLEPGAAATIITPHWNSARAFGDLTHQWPPVSEFWFYYLSKRWRETEAPHNDEYRCDFEATWGYSLHPSLGTRNEEFRQFAVQHYKEAILDLHATLTKR